MGDPNISLSHGHTSLLLVAAPSPNHKPRSEIHTTGTSESRKQDFTLRHQWAIKLRRTSNKQQQHHCQTHMGCGMTVPKTNHGHLMELGAGDMKTGRSRGEAPTMYTYMSFVLHCWFQKMPSALPFRESSAMQVKPHFLVRV